MTVVYPVLYVIYVILNPAQHSYSVLDAVPYPRGHSARHLFGRNHFVASQHIGYVLPAYTEWR